MKTKQNKTPQVLKNMFVLYVQWVRW